MKRLLKWSGIGLLLLVAGIILVYAGFELTFLVVQSRLPTVIDRGRFDREIWQVSRVYAGDESLLAEFYKERRTVVPVEELPEQLIQAVVAAEDKNFFRHYGVDWVAVARAIVVDSVRGRMVQGASTLTQQLARNLYLSRERTLLRKVKEALLARKLERSLKKQEILHQYLNLIYWGHGCYGAEEASRFYFGKSARDLDLGESVMLAGIIKGPEILSPLRAPEKTRARMAYVMRQMRSAGFVSDETPDPPLPAIAGYRLVQPNLAPYGVDAVLVAAHRTVGREGFDTAGWQLDTTLDPGLQEAMNGAIAAFLPELGVAVSVREEAPESLCDCVVDGVVRPGCSLWAQVLQATESGYVVDLLGRLGVVPGDALERFAGRGIAAGALAPEEWVRTIPTREFNLSSPWLTEEILVVPVVTPQVAAVLMDAESGAVLALYGGVDHRYHPFNRAITARRQMGSTIKPFLYLAAMEMMAWDAETRVESTPLHLTQAEGRRWLVKDAHDHGSSLTVGEALAYSSNTAAVRTMLALGTDNFLAEWQRWGLPELDVQDASLALGSASLSPLEMASAYALLARADCAPQPLLLRELAASYRPRAALPGRSCSGRPPAVETRAVARLLEGVLDRDGTGYAAALQGVAAFGKTGTTTGGRDAWFAGVFRRPDTGSARVLVVWIGSDDFTPVEGNSGPHTAARLWHGIAASLLAVQ